MKEKNVLQVGKFYYPVLGGVETVEFDITEMLNQRGTPCDVLCTNTTNVATVDVINSYKVYRASTFTNISSTSISLDYIWTLRRLVHKYDILHVHLPNPLANLALMFADIKNKKVVIHWHSDIVKQKMLLPLYRPLQTWLLKRADAIIGTSDKYIQESPELHDFTYKCVSVPIGIDSNRLSSDTNKVVEIKRRFSGKKIILSLGRHVYYKGFKYLIESAKYMRGDYVIVIGGEGPLTSELHALIIRENLSDRVFLIGRISNEELGSYFEACDIFCLPSIMKSEAFGVVQIEAMSFGKPVVATIIDGSGTCWVNEDGVSGINVPVKDSAALADAFHKIADENTTYTKFSYAAKERFENIFRREVMINKIESVYTNISE